MTSQLDVPLTVRLRDREGIELVTESLGRRQLGPYQMQAAISALHAEADAFDNGRLVADPGSW